MKQALYVQYVSSDAALLFVRYLYKLEEYTSIVTLPVRFLTFLMICNEHWQMEFCTQSVVGKHNTVNTRTQTVRWGFYTMTPSYVGAHMFWMLKTAISV
jgi:hypothetical protein